MLGYVQCATGEMLVKHHSLYQAMYCGLCHSIGKNTTRALLPFLSYDFVFLATLRLMVSGESLEAQKQFCPLHPFRKGKKRIKDNSQLCYASQAALFLTYEKMRDDLLDRDTSFGRRMLIFTWAPVLKRACHRLIRRTPQLAALFSSLTAAMEEGRRLEKSGASLDDMCASFARCLSLIFSFGLEGEAARILSSLGGYLGRFIYTLDALDDLEEDEKKDSFNPVLLRYGSAEQARIHFEDLDLVLAYYVNQMKLALDLLDGDKNLFAICDNIICLGLSESARKVMKPKTEKSA